MQSASRWSQDHSERNSIDANERMAREIKGCIYALLALFQLIALTSYLPLDSLNIFQGRLDHINNLGGLVGAAVAEIFLGTFGILGYSIILITLWLSQCAFRGIPLRENISQLTGALLGNILGAITCQLFFGSDLPEWNLLQGGYVGRLAGQMLQSYLHTSGSLVLVSGGFIITFLLTTRFSIIRFLENLFSDDTPEEEESENHRRSLGAKTSSLDLAPRKRSKKNTKRSAEEDTSDSTEADGDESEDSEPDENENTPVDPNAFQEIRPFTGSYSLPSARLLKSDDGGARRLSRGEIKENAKKLCEHLLSFQITGNVVSVAQGPVLTTYEYKPTAGVKLSKIAALQDDLGVILGTRELRIIAPIPGKTVVGIEVPRPSREIISLKDVISEKSFYDKKLKIPIALGKSTDGVPVFADLTTMPHLLVAGATGSGKSVFINCLIISLLYRLAPDELRLILIDPKMLELTIFDGLPHLVTNVITNNNVAFTALNWAVQEMERRYNLMAEMGSKNIDSYNSKRKSNRLPYIVIIVDELADIMMSGGEAVEIAITRLAQKARAAGIHLILATQRPSTDVVTGLIKANIPSRISFKVPSGIDSRTVIDASGAEELIGKGDCLMLQPGIPLRRLHACFVTEDELARIVKNATGGRNHTKSYIQFSDQKPDEE